MAVPETAVDEHNSFVFSENNVGPAGESLVLKAETESCRMKGFADQDFRLGILSLDAGHHPAACGLVDNVSQRLPFSHLWSSPL